MASLEARLTEMLEPAVEALNFELVGIEFVRAGKHSTLRIYIDHENGIDVEDCAAVSHQVSAVLDVEDPISTEYNLEVSSPGVEYPFFKLAHFERFLGEEAFVRLRMPQDGQRKFQGTLLRTEGSDIVISANGKEVTFSFDNVEKAHLVAKF